MMVANTLTTYDLETSLQNVRLQREENFSQLKYQQSLLESLQVEVNAFTSAQARREQAEAAFRPQVREADEMLQQARDYAKATTGSVKNAAMDDVLAAEALHKEMEAQYQALISKHQKELQEDQPFIDDFEAKIRSAKLTISQLEGQRDDLKRVHDRLHAELGQSCYAHWSAILRHPREEKARLERESEHNDGFYAQLRAKAFPKLDEWPDLKRKLQEENEIVDDSDIHALLQYAQMCEYLAQHKIQDMSTVLIFEIPSDQLGAYEGGSNNYLFAERARMARQRLAELKDDRR